MLIIDPGNSSVKVTDGKRELIFPSIIGPAQEIFSEKNVTQIEGYYVGEDAFSYASVVDYSLCELKSEQRTLNILIKYALAQFPREKDIVFVLPYSNFFDEKRKLIEMFSDYNVNALPQGFCALMDFLTDDKGEVVDKKMLKRPILVEDIGFGNTNLIYFSGGKVNHNLSFSTLNGMRVIYSKAAASTGRNIYEIDLTSGRDSLKPLYPSLASVLQSDVESRYRLSDISLHLVCGGGSNAIFDHLPWTNKLLHSSQFGNVRGGMKVGRKLWGSAGHLEVVKK